MTNWKLRYAMTIALVCFQMGKRDFAIAQESFNVEQVSTIAEQLNAVRQKMITGAYEVAKESLDILKTIKKESLSEKDRLGGSWGKDSTRIHSHCFRRKEYCRENIRFYSVGRVGRTGAQEATHDDDFSIIILFLGQWTDGVPTVFRSAI